LFSRRCRKAVAALSLYFVAYNIGRVGIFKRTNPQTI
jgi:hypothetical protein